MDTKWCCKTSEDPCIGEGKNIICNGTTLSLSDQCNNESYDSSPCNYYPMDTNRSQYGDGIYNSRIDRSFLDMCQDNRYVCAALQSRFWKEICYTY